MKSEKKHCFNIDYTLYILVKIYTTWSTLGLVMIAQKFSKASSGHLLHSNVMSSFSVSGDQNSIRQRFTDSFNCWQNAVRVLYVPQRLGTTLLLSALKQADMNHWYLVFDADSNSTNEYKFFGGKSSYEGWVMMLLLRLVSKIKTGKRRRRVELPFEESQT